MYDITRAYRPGKQMQLADTLGRAYLPHTDSIPLEVEVQNINIVQDLSLAAVRLEDIQAHTAQDGSLQVSSGVVQNRWPQDKRDVPVEAMTYFNGRDELSVQNGIILRGERGVIPKTLRHAICSSGFM